MMHLRGFRGDATLSVRHKMSQSRSSPGFADLGSLYWQIAARNVPREPHRLVAFLELVFRAVPEHISRGRARVFVCRAQKILGAAQIRMPQLAKYALKACFARQQQRVVRSAPQRTEENACALKDSGLTMERVCSASCAAWDSCGQKIRWSVAHVHREPSATQQAGLNASDAQLANTRRLQAAAAAQTACLDVQPTIPRRIQRCHANAPKGITPTSLTAVNVTLVPTKLWGCSFACGRTVSRIIAAPV
mmetsp:Transcript_48348/g.109652  ORF Transcript_48348/g.109652 Transcript_48348/m.109652 type:complete len:248 (+) Transcript_48348:333-1076(+)